MPFKIGPLELVIILLIVIAIFGAGKLASVGGSIGKAVKDFRVAVKDPENKDKANKQEASTLPVEPPPAKDTTDSDTPTKAG